MGACEVVQHMQVECGDGQRSMQLVQLLQEQEGDKRRFLHTSCNWRLAEQAEGQGCVPPACINTWGNVLHMIRPLFACMSSATCCYAGDPLPGDAGCGARCC